MNLELILTKELCNDDDWICENLLRGHVFSLYKESSYKNDWKNIWLRNVIHQEELQRISLLSTKLSNDIIILKGAALLGDIYEDLGMRFMSDIDVLVDFDDWQEFENQIIAMGYEKHRIKLWAGNSFKAEFSKTIKGVDINIEVHSRLFYHLEDFKWNIVDSDYSGIKKLGHEDMLVHLIGHYAFQHNFSKVFWLVDIFLYVQKYRGEIDWSIVLKIANQLKLKRSLQTVMWILRDYIDVNHKLSSPNIFIKLVINKEFINFPRKNLIKYFVVKHLIKDNLFTAILYDLKWGLHVIKSKALKVLSR